MSLGILPEEDQTSKTYSDSYFLAQYGGTLPAEMVMDYFAASPFWDKDSANARLKMQMTGQPPLTPKEFEQRLTSMPGVQFFLQSTQTVKDSAGQDHTIYTIRKQQRVSADEILPIGMYYILDKIIFQSPSLLSALSSRVLKGHYFIQNALAEVSQFVEFDPVKDYDWFYSHEKAATFKRALDDAQKERENRGTVKPEQLDRVFQSLKKQTEANRRKRPEPPGQPDSESAAKRAKTQ